MNDFSEALSEALIREAERTAEERERLHDGDPGGRQLTKNTHLSGLLGEIAFGKMIGMMPDFSKKRSGDGGIDFTVPLVFTMDVKSRKRIKNGGEFYMLVEEAKVDDSDIYICAVLHDDMRGADPIGWQWAKAVKKFPVGVLRDGIRNHQVPVNGGLRPIRELQDRLPNWRASIAVRPK